MKLSQIKKKFPKAWGEFEKSYPLRINADTNIRIWWSDLTDFFDKRDILISTNGCYEVIGIGKVKKRYDFDIRVIENLKVDIDPSESYWYSRKLAETSALTKAFEILENKLKGETK